MGKTTTVTTTSGLLGALSTAHGGDTILLAAGAYSNVDISGVKITGTVTIASADLKHQAVLKDLQITGSNGLAFNNLEFSTVGATFGSGGPSWTNQFQVSSSSNIKFTHANVHGDPNGTLATDVNGFFVRYSTNVAFVNSHFEHLHYAIGQAENNGFTVTGSSFYHIWDDGIRGGGTSNVTISGNAFSSFHMDASDTDHPDAIQFWTSPGFKPANNINITNNTYIRGDGNPVQGIFLRDEVGNIPYTNVTISGNHVSGSSYNAIFLEDAHLSKIINNVVTAYNDNTAWIRILDSKSVTESGNFAPAYYYTNDSLLTLVNNQINAPVPNPHPHALGPVSNAAAFSDLTSASALDHAYVPIAHTGDLLF